MIIKKMIDFINSKREEFIQQLCKSTGLEANDVKELYRKEIERMVKRTIKMQEGEI